MASLSELRDALTALGVSTSTGLLRGEERRVLLQQRLLDAQHKLGGVEDPAQSVRHGSLRPQNQVQKTDQDATCHSYSNMSLGELRTELDKRHLPTHTPGLKGDARRHALLQRLLNTAGASATDATLSPVAVWEENTKDESVLSSARSSASSSYSAASEFLFIDLPSSKTTTRPPVPSLSLPASSPPSKKLLQRTHKQIKPTLQSVEANDNSAFASTSLVREQLEQELVDLRRQLHDQRAARAQATTARLQAAGFQRDLDSLSTTMERLERERQRLVGVAFAHELVTTMVVDASGKAVVMELVQEDAVRLIETRQHHVRCQIAHTKDAIAIVQQQHDATNQTSNADAEIQASIRRITLQLQLHYPTARSSAVSTGPSDQDSARSSSSSIASSISVAVHGSPVLTRCRSMPPSLFHETWRQLDDTQKQQLHHELKAAKSFRIRTDRVCVGEATHTNASMVSAAVQRHPSTGRQSILAFTRYPPTVADKLGIKALFLEQSQRSVVEIQRVYQQALAAEPQHAIVLGNYARFLYQRCHQLEKAELVFCQAVRVDPLCVANLASFARFLHHTRRDLVKAEELYIQVLRLTPRDPVVLGDYASLLYTRAKKKDCTTTTTATSTTSQLVQAKQFLLQAIEMDVSSSSIATTGLSNRLRLCAIHEELSEIQDAQRCYERLVKDVDQWRQGSGTSTGNGNQETPTPRTMGVMVTWAHVYGNFANFLQRTGRVERAKCLYKTALQLAPEDALLQRNFSMFLREYRAVVKPTGR